MQKLMWQEHDKLTAEVVWHDDKDRYVIRVSYNLSIGFRMDYRNSTVQYNIRFDLVSNSPQWEDCNDIIECRNLKAAVLDLIHYVETRYEPTPN